MKYRVARLLARKRKKYVPLMKKMVDAENTLIRKVGVALAVIDSVAEMTAPQFR